MNTKRNSKKTAGRPKGAKTRFYGINEFASAHGISHQFVRDVLNGKATSNPVMKKWARWMETKSAI